MCNLILEIYSQQVWPVAVLKDSLSFSGLENIEV